MRKEHIVNPVGALLIELDHMLYSKAASGILTCPMLALRVRSHAIHILKLKLVFLVVLGIDSLFRYRYFFIAGLDTKFRYWCFSILEHDTHLKKSILFNTQFRYQSQVSIPNYRSFTRHFSIPSIYLKIVRAISAWQIIIFNQNQSR